MRPIQFEVHGKLPPKKDGAKSMWGKHTDTEPKRLIALRRGALKALGSQPPFAKGIRLALRVHVGRQAPVSVNAGAKGFGDLDNFVAGVCDGLMAAHENVRKEDWHPLFHEPENSDVVPTETIAYEDDSNVVKIDAEKIVGPGDHCYYEIELEGE